MPYLVNVSVSIAKRLETTDDVVVGKINKMAASVNILDEIFVRRYLID